MKELAQYTAYAGIFSVLFIPLIVSDSMFFPFITGKNFWFRIIVEIALAAWIIWACYEPRVRPRFSWLLPSLGVLLVVMFFANLFGVHPQSSFWSNYERMDGYVTLVHFAAYFLVVAHVLSNREFDFFGYRTTTWQLYFVTALVAAILVSFTAFRQLSGVAEITMGARMNGTLGNAAYMAVYMLFNTFIALWVALHAKSNGMRWFALSLTLLFAFLLFQTGTRGTNIGLVSGILVGGLYIAIFNVKYPKVRAWALGAVAFVILLGSGLYAIKDTEFGQNSLAVQRATAVNLSELSLRLDIWNLALEGVAERPVLGWGQNNFNYVFNEHYRPDFAWRAEQWYDRAHNVFMDWLITGGVLGLVAYLSLFFVALYYLFVQPFFRESRFTVLERGLLLGIGAGYFVHNLVVFDNLVSFIFFAAVLALIHERVASPISALERFRPHPAVVGQVVAPIVVVVAAVTVYFVNVPGMLAAQDIIVGFQAQTVAGKQEAFERAFARGGFAQQELTEQLAQQALSIASNPQVPPEEAQAFLSFAEAKLTELAADKPGDARVHVFLTSFYRGIGQLDRAREEAVKARELSPQKPHIILEQGIVEYQAGNLDAFSAFTKEAYDLAPQSADMQIFYASARMLQGAGLEEVDTIVSSTTWPQFAANNFALQTADRAQANDVLEKMLRARIETAPTDPQLRVGLSSVQYRAGNIEGAIATLQQGITDIPSLQVPASCYIENLQNGREPGLGCE